MSLDFPSLTVLWVGHTRIASLVLIPRSGPLKGLYHEPPTGDILSHLGVPTSRGQESISHGKEKKAMKPIPFPLPASSRRRQDGLLSPFHHHTPMKNTLSALGSAAFCPGTARNGRPGSGDTQLDSICVSAGRKQHTNSPASCYRGEQGVLCPICTLVWIYHI